MKDSFGARLRHHRKTKLGPCRVLAEKTGISKDLLTKYERNEVEPGFIRLRQICKALGVTPNDLLH